MALYHNMHGTWIYNGTALVICVPVNGCLRVVVVTYSLESVAEGFGGGGMRRGSLSFLCGTITDSLGFWWAPKSSAQDHSAHRLSTILLSFVFCKL